MCVKFIEISHTINIILFSSNIIYYHKEDILPSNDKLKEYFSLSLEPCFITKKIPTDLEIKNFDNLDLKSVSNIYICCSDSFPYDISKWILYIMKYCVVRNRIFYIIVPNQYNDSNAQKLTSYLGLLYTFRDKWLLSNISNDFYVLSYIHDLN